MQVKTEVGLSRTNMFFSILELVKESEFVRLALFELFKSTIINLNDDTEFQLVIISFRFVQYKSKLIEVHNYAFISSVSLRRSFCGIEDGSRQHTYSELHHFNSNLSLLKQRGTP